MRPSTSPIQICPGDAICVSADVPAKAVNEVVRPVPVEKSSIAVSGPAVAIAVETARVVAITDLCLIFIVDNVAGSRL